MESPRRALTTALALTAMAEAATKRRSVVTQHTTVFPGLVPGIHRAVSLERPASQRT